MNLIASLGYEISSSFLFKKLRVSDYVSVLVITSVPKATYFDFEFFGGFYFRHTVISATCNFYGHDSINFMLFLFISDFGFLWGFCWAFMFM